MGDNHEILTWAMQKADEIWAEIHAHKIMPFSKEKIRALTAVEAETREANRDALDVLSALSSYFGMGMGDETTTAEEYHKRIRKGIDDQAEGTQRLIAETAERVERETLDRCAGAMRHDDYCWPEFGEQSAAAIRSFPAKYGKATV
jgi:hypothetical protein